MVEVGESMQAAGDRHGGSVGKVLNYISKGCAFKSEHLQAAMVWFLNETLNLQYLTCILSHS